MEKRFDILFNIDGDLWPGVELDVIELQKAEPNSHWQYATTITAGSGNDAIRTVLYYVSTITELKVRQSDRHNNRHDPSKKSHDPSA